MLAHGEPKAIEVPLVQCAVKLSSPDRTASGCARGA